MVPPRVILRSFGLFLLIYGLLIVPWPGVKSAYAMGVRATGRVLLSNFGGLGTVEFQRVEGAEPADPDIVMHLRDRENTTINQVSSNSRHLGYLPTVTLIALILATPAPWPRRRRALYWGLLLVTGFVFLRLALLLLDGFSEAHPFFIARPYWRAVIWRASTLVSLSSVWFMAPIVIWSLVSFRTADWIADGARTAPEPDPERDAEATS